jgi:diacylglycerol kinase (ATP)
MQPLAGAHDADAARRAALLFNPSAGQGRSGRALGSIAAILRTAYRLDVLPTSSARQLEEHARRAVDQELDALFVLGGDGSLQLAAGQLAGSSTALAPLPGGTTNVVATALGLPRDPVAAARALLDATARELDLGGFQSSDRQGVFLMQISGGLDARVMAAVDPRWKRRFGKLAIAWTGLRELARYAFPPFALEVDGDPATATGFVAANLAEYAGSFEIVPGARADDGALDLLLFHGRTRRAALGFALDLARGRHVERSDVEIRRFERLVLTAPRPLALQGDGDPFAAEPPLEIRLSARRLKVLVPTRERGPAAPPPR